MKSWQVAVLIILVILFICFFLKQNENLITVPNRMKIYDSYNVSNNFSTDGYTQPTIDLSTIEHSRAEDYDSTMPPGSDTYAVMMQDLVSEQNPY